MESHISVKFLPRRRNAKFWEAVFLSPVKLAIVRGFTLESDIVFHAVSATPCTLLHLSIVGPFSFREDEDGLVFLHRLADSVCEVAAPVLDPYPFVAKHLWVAHDKCRTERLTCCKSDNSPLTKNSPILFPKRFERDNRVPLVLRRPIRQIAQDHINRTGRNIPHQFETVAMPKVLTQDRVKE